MKEIRIERMDDLSPEAIEAFGLEEAREPGEEIEDVAIDLVYNHDPDFIVMDGVKTPFIETEEDNVIYVILGGDLNGEEFQKAARIITRFLEEGWTGYFEKVDFKFSQEAQKGVFIWYRGGRGYVYTRWVLR